MYSREIDDRVLTLAASGWTYRDTFILFDLETESLWYHLQGTDGLTCISGFYADRRLGEFPSTLTRWQRWKEQYPNLSIYRFQ